MGQLLERLGYFLFQHLVTLEKKLDEDVKEEANENKQIYDDRVEIGEAEKPAEANFTRLKTYFYSMLLK